MNSTPTVYETGGNDYVTVEKDNVNISYLPDGTGNATTITKDTIPQTFIVRVYDFDANKYVFFCIKLKDYCSFMKVRSGKWQTVTLPADKFRDCAVQIRNLLL